MDQAAIERLRHYLAQLPPGTQALLMREFERTLARGEDTAVAELVLDQLRQVVRKANDNARARSGDAERLVFAPLEPFLVDAGAQISPGCIRRASLEAVWQWLAHDALPDQTGSLVAALAAGDPGDIAMRAYRAAAGEAIIRVAASGVEARGDGRRSQARLASPKVIEDLPAIGAVLAAHEALDAFADRIPDTIVTLGGAQTRVITDALGEPALQAPAVLPFALALLMARLESRWQLIRLPIHAAGSDDEARVAAVPQGIAVTMVLHDLSRACAALCADIRRGRLRDIADRLKALHDGVRGLRTELDLRGDSVWGRHLAAIRKEISGGLEAEIEGVPGRVRRLLRQRPDREITATARLDPGEIDETAEMIAFVAACRGVAGELAISEVTQRAYSELLQYVERASVGLVQSLKAGEPRVRAYRQAQMAAAVRFCEPLFGTDYAALMARSAENALAERSVPRAG